MKSKVEVSCVWLNLFVLEDKIYDFQNQFAQSLFYNLKLQIKILIYCRKDCDGSWLYLVCGP